MLAFLDIRLHYHLDTNLKQFYKKKDLDDFTGTDPTGIVKILNIHQVL